MLAGHEERFARIVGDYLERPAGDYAELLHRSRVASPEGVDPEAWREEIRRQARQDKIRVITRRDGARALAMLNPSLSDEHANEFMAVALARGQMLEGLADTARRLGHEPTGWLRSDDEYASACSRCQARIYTRLETQTVEDGERSPSPAQAPKGRGPGSAGWSGFDVGCARGHFRGCSLGLGPVDLLGELGR